MWKFIVFWCLTTVVHDPPPRPVPDEFGRMPSTMYQDAVFRYHLVYDCDHQKYFTDRKDAVAFYDRAKAEITGSMYDGIANVRFDSVKDMGDSAQVPYYFWNRGIKLDTIGAYGIPRYWHK
jgi:hypothetical protein